MLTGLAASLQPTIDGVNSSVGWLFGANHMRKPRGASGTTAVENRCFLLSAITFVARRLTLLGAAANFPALPSSPMKTFSAKADQVDRKWWLIDARDQVLGRVAVKAANLLRGKEKTILTPHVDTGDFVIVINAEKVRLTGKKEEQKSYMSFSGFVGGHKSETVRSRRARHPELLVEHAVRGMIPHNRLGRGVYRKLKVYRGEEHPHAAQKPQAVTLD
jgi:large subunit ribosomal protein L13